MTNERILIMKEAVDKILENKDNIGLDFVVHVRNEDLPQPYRV